MKLLTCFSLVTSSITLFLSRIHCNQPEQGIYSFHLKQNKLSEVLTRFVYEDTTISLKLLDHCEQKDEEKRVSIGWVMRSSKCYDEYTNLLSNKSAPVSRRLYAAPYTHFVQHEGYTQSNILDCKNITFSCLDAQFTTEASCEFKNMTLLMRKRREASSTPTSLKKTPKIAEPTIDVNVSEGWSAVYAIVFKSAQAINITVSFKNPYHGYLSPIDYPLLVVYGLLCAIYIIFAFTWLILLALNWKDILRLQYWIAAVIALGLMEKAVFISEYNAVYQSGKSVNGAVVIATIISCLKRALARMLIIIASVGFGIVKPRLGPMLHKVLGVGGVYFIYSCVVGWYETKLERVGYDKPVMYLQAVLIFGDVFICIWIFSNLITTLRTLRLRRNIIKHSVYRHFTHTLIAAVLLSLAFLIWFVVTHKVYPMNNKCISDFSMYWLDEAFWPTLFSAILLVMMVLWRPTANNQRYAFSPLLDHGDDDDEDEEEIVMNDVYEGMKQRGLKEKPYKKDLETKADEDLKWVEDNIPASIADKALAIDSDDDREQTRIEMAKMD